MFLLISWGKMPGTERVASLKGLDAFCPSLHPTEEGTEAPRWEVTCLKPVSIYSHTEVWTLKSIWRLPLEIRARQSVKEKDHIVSIWLYWQPRGQVHGQSSVTLRSSEWSCASGSWDMVGRDLF